MMRIFIVSLLSLVSLAIYAEEAPQSPPPLREVSVILSAEGYYPKSISVFQGEKVRFFVTSTIEGPGCMMVEDHKVFLSATKGKISETEVIFKNAGDFPVYCPGNKEMGKVVVISKEVPKREVASEKKEDPSKMIWMPREY